jgi:hypothetical protein
MALPEFETPRLILKAVTLKDEASYQKYFVDSGVIRHLSSGVLWPYPTNRITRF